MSSVDQRVVQMEFDNSRFESNVKTTMSTLDRLKEKLHFGGEKDTLRELEQAGNSFNMDHMANAIDTIANRFTLMGSIAFNAMDKIAQKAVQVGQQIVSSLTVEMPKAGMVKYEQETNSVQAIYNSVKNKGKSLQDVYDGLQRLAEYSDETSYSYTQMVDGASKFIANGVDMDVAVSAMMGISNAAAYAGVGINDASAAYKNFADAMSKGYFLQKDWISIQGIHMDTEQLRQDVIDTARALGKLDEAGRVIDRTTGKAKDVLTTENFVDMLRYGFFDKDVIQQLFGGKYADFDFDRVRKGADAFETIGDEMAAAAQQAKTFTDVIDSVKDAGSTGWKTTWRLIFGDLNEAINFFTPMANSLIEVVNAIDGYRNDMLQSWRDSGGREAMIEGLQVLWENAKKVTAVFEEGFGSVFKVTFGADAKTAGERLAEFTKRIAEAGKSFIEWFGGDTADGTQRAYAFYNISKGISASIDIVRQAFSGINTFTKNITAQLSPTFDKILVLFSDIGDGIYQFWGRLTDSGYFQDLANRISKWFEPITSRLPGVVDKIRKFGESIATFVKTNPVMVRLTTSFKNLFNSIIDNMPKAIEGLIQFGKNIINTVKNSEEWKRIKLNYNTHLKPIISGIGEFAGRAIQGLADFFNFDSSKINGGWWEKLKARFSSTIGTIGPWVSEQWDKIKAKYPIVQKISDWWDTSTIGKAVKGFVGSFKDSIDKFFGADTSGEGSIFGKIKSRFSAFWDSFGPWLSESWNKIREKYPIVKNIADWFGSIGSNIKNWWNTSSIASGIKDFGSKIGSFFSSFFNVDTSGITGTFNKLKARFSALWGDFASWISEKWEKIKAKFPSLESIGSFITGLFPGGNTEGSASVETAGTSVFDKLKSFWESIKQFFAGIDYGTVAKYVALAYGVVKVVRGIYFVISALKTGSTFRKTISNFNGLITDFRSKLAGKDIKAEKFKSIADGILKIAGSITAISAAVVLIGNLDAEAFKQGIITVGAITLGLVTIQTVMGKLNAKSGDKVGKSILGIGAGILALSAAIALMGVIPTGIVTKGSIIVGSILAVLTLVSKFLNKTNIDIKPLTFVGIAGAIMMLVLPITALGALSAIAGGGWLWTGFAMVSAILLELAVISRIMNKVDMGAVKVSGFIAMAVAIDLLTLPVIALGALSSIAGGGWLWTGVLVVVALVAALGMVIKALNNVNIHIGKAIAVIMSIIPFIAMMATFVAACLILKDIPIETIAVIAASTVAVASTIALLEWVAMKVGSSKFSTIVKGVIAEFAAAAVFVVALAAFCAGLLIVKDIPIETMLSLAGSMVIVAVAVGILESVATKVGNSKFSSVVKGIVAELGAAVIFVTALAAFCFGLTMVKDVPTDTMFSLAASMVIVAVAIGILEGVATKVGNSKFSSIIKGAVAELAAAVVFAGAMAAFCVAVNMVKDVDPQTMLVFAASGVIVSVAISMLAAVAGAVGKFGIGAVLSGAVAELAAALTFAVEMAAFCVGAMMVKDIDPQTIVTFAASSVIVSSAISILAAVASAVGKLGIVSILSGAVAELAAALVLAGAMALFCIGVQQVKDIDAETMLAFAASCVGVSVALGALGLVVAAMGAIPIALVAKGVAALAIVAIGVSLIVSIAAALVGAALEGFAANMTSVAGGLTIFNDLCGGLDQGAITSTVDLLKSMADSFVEIGTKKFGDLESFITDTVGLYVVSGTFISSWYIKYLFSIKTIAKAVATIKTIFP